MSPAGKATSTTAATAAEDEEEQKKYTSELQHDTDTFEVLYSNKAKMTVQVKQDGAPATWDNRGVGVLSVRKAKQGSNRKPCIYFTTESGKHLVVSSILPSTNVNIAASNPKRAALSVYMAQKELPPAGTDSDASNAEGQDKEPKYVVSAV
eukprot:jgi/Chrzof1/9777/Cz04g15120.t1